MLQLSNVHKSYKQAGQSVQALRGVDLNITGPGFFAIMGPSGSGKTTLLHLIAGLDKADNGSVVINGENLSTLSETKLTEFRRRKLGIVFQKFNLIPTLSAQQNVELPGRLDGRPNAWLHERSLKLLADLGLKDRAHHRPDALSGGEQQRVAIARALLFEPGLLLADEPTGNLDSNNAQKLWALLKSLASQQNLTVVMVTHEPAAASNCQRVYVIGDGKLKGDFPTDNLDAAGVASRYQQLGQNP